MRKNDPVSPHVLQMIGYFDNLKRLNATIDKELAIDIVLQSLPPSYHDFIMNYNMHDKKSSLIQLHGMLKFVEADMKKGQPQTTSVLNVQKERALRSMVVVSRARVKERKKLLILNPNLRLPRISLKMSATIVVKGDIGKETARNTWRIRRMRMWLPLQSLRRSRPVGKDEVDLRVDNEEEVAALAVGIF